MNKNETKRKRVHAEITSQTRLLNSSAMEKKKECESEMWHGR